MRYVKGFINKQNLDFIEVGSYDEEELAELGALSFRNVSLELDALRCLRFFPNVENLILRPGELKADDLKYLKGVHITALKLDYYSDCTDLYTIDLSQFPKLLFLFSRSQYNFSNVARCQFLCTLVVQEWFCKDLTYLSGSNLQALCLFSGKLQNLKGIESLHQLRSVSIANQRQLFDAHCLESCCDLESLAIEKCSHLSVSLLPALPSLRYLALIRTEKLADLSFLDNYPKLEYLILDVLVADGNMQMLSRFKHSVIMTDHRHYSEKNADLPKSQQKYHSNSIPSWLEIIP